MREQRGLNATTFKRRASLPAQYRTGQPQASPHRSGHHPRHKAPPPDDDEIAEEYPQRTRSSAIVYRQPYTQVELVRHTEELEQQPRRGKHPMFYIGICMVIMVVFLMAYTFIPPAFQKWQDDKAYGYPRTYQTDANVGHGGMEHFIALNNHGTIEVLEIPNDPSKTSQPHLYIISHFAGQGADLLPATIAFTDVNGGKPTMVVTVYNGTNPTEYIMFNNGTTFVPKL